MKTYKVELTEEFIKEAHEEADNKWKAKIKYLVPEAFKNQFEVGKWYKLKQDLCNPKVLINYQGLNSGYGINGLGDWEESSEWSFKTFPEAWKPATDKEVEEALIKEAKKRGFIEGVKYNYPDKPTIEARQIIGNDFNYLQLSNALCNNHNGIFHRGVWAKPIEKPTLKRIQEIEEELKQLKEKL